MSVYIIAEAGVNHNGDLKIAKKLCDAAKEAGVDAVKFQTWKTEKLVTKSAAKANYQTENTGNEENQFQMLKKLELSFDDFRELHGYCNKIGIDFLSTPDEEDSLDFLVNDLGLSLIKIGSGEVTNIPYLRKIGKYKKHVILSTGMSNLAQVKDAYNVLIDSGASCVDLLHCTTNYPCPYNEVNLRAMLTLKNEIGCAVGYSDHTLGIEISVAAVAMGAEIIEKHFTLDKNMEGPDHKASLSPYELKQLVLAIRHIEQAMGDGVKRPNASEIKISKVVQKTIVAKSKIKKGEKFSIENITVKRADVGIPASNWDDVVGKISSREYNIDEPIIL